MGKNLGFLEYQRKTSQAEEPLERIKHYNEFHLYLSNEEQSEQAARCMDCGVPYCQSGVPVDGKVTGCPLNNHVPEWNDLVYNGKFEAAYKRLRKTNNFPEFTSRVCPALCEMACTCGLDSDPVSVHENEFAIIETAYDKGYVKPAQRYQQKRHLGRDRKDLHHRFQCGLHFGQALLHDGSAHRDHGGYRGHCRDRPEGGRPLL